MASRESWASNKTIMSQQPHSEKPSPLFTSGRILVVDDEAIIRFSLVDTLQQNGYTVDEAASGYEAIHLLERTPYELMILDMRMPGLDGINVLQFARQLASPPSVIVLTGHATLESAITAVRADEVVDYLCKPITGSELLETVNQALQKRAWYIQQRQLMEAASYVLETVSQPPLTLADPASQPSPFPVKSISAQRFICVEAFTLDRQKRLIMIESTTIQTIELTRGETDVLACLMNAPYRVLSCRELAQAAWEYKVNDHEAASLIRPYIFRLRQKIEPNPKHPTLIHTVRRRGYSFIPDASYK